MSLITPVEDGLPMNEYGDWTKKKLFYIQRYLEVFTTSMYKKPWRRRYYIDLFAGSGKCRSRETGEIYLGASLLALSMSHPFTHYVFADLNEANIKTLRDRCDALPNRDALNVRFLVGDSNQIVTQIVDEIIAIDRQHMQGQWSSLNLALLDQEGLELEWTTVATLARVRRMDQIIFYPEGGLNRQMPNEYQNDREGLIDRFFGNKIWRDYYRRQQAIRVHAELIRMYRENLANLGYTDFRSSEEIMPLMRNTQRNAPLYRLLFASKHDLGADFWNKVTSRDIYGQGRLF